MGGSDGGSFEGCIVRNCRSREGLYNGRRGVRGGGRSTRGSRESAHILQR